jgi:hypothetical protein
VDTAHLLKIQEALAQQRLAKPARRHKRRYRLGCVIRDGYALAWRQGSPPTGATRLASMA